MNRLEMIAIRFRSNHLAKKEPKKSLWYLIVTIASSISGTSKRLKKERALTINIKENEIKKAFNCFKRIFSSFFQNPAPSLCYLIVGNDSFDPGHTQTHCGQSALLLLLPCGNHPLQVGNYFQCNYPPSEIISLGPR